MQGRLPETAGDPLSVGVGRGGRGSVLGVALSKTPDHSNRYRGSEDLEVVVIHLVSEPGLTDLVEAVKLVEVHAEAVGHNQTVEGHGQALLPGGFNRMHFT